MAEPVGNHSMAHQLIKNVWKLRQEVQLNHCQILVKHRSNDIDLFLLLRIEKSN